MAHSDGKGRVLLLASEFPFQQVIGVEIDPRLHHIAQKNIAAYRHPFQKCEDVQSICSDVTRFPRGLRSCFSSTLSSCHC